MKTKKFLGLLLASVMLVACSDDNDDDGGVVKDPKGKAWISLSIRNANTGNGLRSLNATDEDPGTADESTVKNVRAIFFDDATDPLVIEDMALSSEEAGDPLSPSGAAGKPFQVDASAKNVMIIINPPAGYTQWPAGTPYSTVNAAVDAAVGTVTSSTTGFLMTNSKGDLEPSNAAGTKVDLTLYATELAAQSSPLVINVDRVVAKVRLYTAGYTSPNATVSDIGWTLNVTNKKYFPMAQRVHTFADTPTPFDKYDLGSYRIDPNYNHSAPLIEYPSATYDANYDYFISNSTPSFGPAVDNSGVPMYCLENTQRAEDNNFAYTTQILLKAKYLPTTFTNQDATTSAPDPANNGDWMRIGGAAYDFTSLMTFITDELTRKYTSSNPGGIGTPRANALNNYLDSVGIAQVPLPNTPQTPATVIAQFQAKKGEIDALSDAAKAGTYGTFSYYAKAICYYKIAVKHDDVTSDKNELGEFGVVRNSVYDVKITKFNNPGIPEIPDPDPVDPIDPEDGSWLSVQIDINPWTWYVQEEEL